MTGIISEKKKIALGLSGGVDSSVAAYLLREQGYEVTGVYIQCWEKKSDGCASDEDKAYALQSAAKLGIKFMHLDFIAQYKSKVIDYFYSEYQNGRTPNPDVMCNKEIKFGMFYDWAMEHGYDFVSTGHYARVVNESGKYQLHCGLDETKDQSYFLYLLDQNHLSRVLMPIGDLKKSDVRKIAKQIQLPTAARPDSMGVCFIGEVDIKEFIKKQIPEKTGIVKNKAGEIVGSHDGAWYYTIGQRHGFKIDKYTGKPVYIIDKNTSTNELIVGLEEDVYSNTFSVSDLHWINEDIKENLNKELTVRVRHLGKIVSCKLSEDAGSLNVETSEKLFGIAPGQSAVFYDGTRVLGGGIIASVKY